jgi:hypothetical protein
MRTRSIIGTAAATTLLSLAVPATAHASTTELVDRLLFDGTPDRTASSLHLAGPTNGELGGAMDLSVTAPDGTLPTTPNTCERVRVKAVVTVRPGTVLTVRTSGQGCADLVSGQLTVNAGFDRHDVTFRGCHLQRARLVGQGLIAVGEQPPSALATFSGTFRW